MHPNVVEAVRRRGSLSSAGTTDLQGAGGIVMNAFGGDPAWHYELLSSGTTAYGGYTPPKREPLHAGFQDPTHWRHRVMPIDVDDIVNARVKPPIQENEPSENWAQTYTRIGELLGSLAASSNR